jgi:putative transposase
MLNISRSEFYDYLQRPRSNRALENEALADEVRLVFHEHKGRYGCKRIQKVLETKHIRVNHKRVARVMRQQGLRAKGARKHYRFYPNKTRYEPQDNILNRVFTTQNKNQVWVGDITYVPTASGFLYLAVFIDIFSRKVVGWSMSSTMKYTLVTSAFNQAYGREHPEQGLLVHTDQGSQYTSGPFVRLLNQRHCIHSMSRKGNPYDNAVSESFFKTLKRELVNDEHYADHEQARRSIFRYIETYYNNQRIHSSLGWVSPSQFESRRENNSVA